GPSGCGKSTLLNILGTLDKADAGELSICSKKISQLSDTALSGFRNRHIGFVFQFHHLLPEFTAEENILMPSRIAGNASRGKSKVEELLVYFGLNERRDHFPSQLSGGERQRLALCRALMNDPDILLADEPTGNLDTGNAIKLIKYLNNLRKEFKQTILVTTHNPEVAKEGNVRLILENGTLRTNNLFEAS
ncbi:MAG: ATP-binding cassette domain-containing protein, partial [Simkaniaceae bacterium]|nr:ATP-binding cassette domain-containing protein [Simkaniaceae bacterium]